MSGMSTITSKCMCRGCGNGWGERIQKRGAVAINNLTSFCTSRCACVWTSCMSCGTIPESNTAYKQIKCKCIRSCQPLYHLNRSSCERSHCVFRAWIWAEVPAMTLEIVQQDCVEMECCDTVGELTLVMHTEIQSGST